MIYGLITIFVSEIPSLLRIFIFKLFNFNKFIILLHTISGILGIIAILYFFYHNPIESSNQNGSFLRTIWNESPIKTIFVGIAYLGFILSFIISSLVLPVFGNFNFNEN
jgi:hypothetical protein